MDRIAEEQWWWDEVATGCALGHFISDRTVLLEWFMPSKKMQ